MLKAIKVNDSTSVFVTFESARVNRLSSTGFDETEMVKCYIHEAKGLEVLGYGLSLRAPEDDSDLEAGGKVAFERAVTQAFPLDKEARAALHKAHRSAVVLYELGF
jgi:hypothetical protein